MLYIARDDRDTIDMFRKYLYTYLKENKLKYSDQRERVLKILYSQSYPISIDFIVKKLNDERDGASYATVSRHIKFFQKINFLITINKTKNTYLLKKNIDELLGRKNCILSEKDAKRIIDAGDFGVCYEPIIRLLDMSVYGYEALSRFKHKGEQLSPEIFFKSVHDNTSLFFSLEMELKKFQLHNAIEDKKLFLNFDPDICIEDKKIDLWFELLHPHKNVVVEVIENSDDESIDNVERFIQWLKKYDFPFAYDDYGKPNSLFFPMLLEQSSYIKLDIFFLHAIKKSLSYLEILKGIVEYSKKRGKNTILEGVETEEDLKIAQEVGIDCIQGYLFKSQFISIWNKDK